MKICRSLVGRGFWRLRGGFLIVFYRKICTEFYHFLRGFCKNSKHAEVDFARAGSVGMDSRGFRAKPKKHEFLIKKGSRNGVCNRNQFWSNSGWILDGFGFQNGAEVGPKAFQNTSQKSNDFRKRFFRSQEGFGGLQGQPWARFGPAWPARGGVVGTSAGVWG